jgi:PAS domain S-box-containing protein
VIRIGRPSVRLWQTELFVIVIVVAILILSVSLSQDLQRTLKTLGEGERLSDVSAIAVQVGSDFPLTAQSRTRLGEQVQQFRLIYGDQVWVFDPDGALIQSASQGGPLPPEIDMARRQGFVDAPPYSKMTLELGGSAVAGKAVYDPTGKKVASVVISGPVTTSLAVLNAVRDRLWITFWIALIVSGLLGLGFAEFIGRRVRQMSRAAAAIADGDFGQQLETGLIPDEIFELAESYNRMAKTLGEVFTALRERDEEITAVVESMGEGVVAFDPAGMVRVINPEAELLLGLEAEAGPAVDRHVSALTDIAAIVELVDRGLAGSASSATAVLGERTVLLHVTPIASAEGGTSGAVLLLGDVTEQKRLEEAQNRFVANASHEMRTPITAVKGMLELLNGGAKEDPEVRDDFLRTMALEVDRLGRLVADLLILARLEAGSLRLHREPVPLRTLLAEVVTVMNPLAEGRGVRLVIDTPDASLEADCDRDRIVQVLIGFVDNALKHSPEGSDVTLRARPHGDKVSLEVEDHGVGIPPEVVPRLFERFFRGEVPQTGPRGTGLGLSIAKELVEAHGSAIEVDTQVGCGATFRFDLPIAT